MQMPSFMIPAGETGIASPDEVERRRLVALALMRQGMDTSPTDMWGGAARLGQSVVGALLNRKADKQERAGRDDANKNFNAIMEKLMGPSSASMQPAGGEVFEPTPYEAQGIPDPRSPEFNVIDDRNLPVDPAMISPGPQPEVMPPQQPQAQPQGADMAQQVNQLPMQEIIGLLNNPYLQPGQAQFLQSIVKSKFDTGEWQSAGQGVIFNNKTGEKMRVAEPDPLESEYKRAQIAKMQAEIAGMGQPDAPSGYRFNADGSMSFIPGGPADPSVKASQGAGGVTTKMRNDAEAADRAYRNLDTALTNYQSLITNGGISMVPGRENDQIIQARTDLQLQLKELYNLGVLNGPDLALMEQMIFDPQTSWTDPAGSISKMWDASQGTLGDRATKSIESLRTKLKTIRDNRTSGVLHSPAAADAPPEDENDYGEGEIVENDQGQRLILQNGQWVPYGN